MNYQEMKARVEWLEMRISKLERIAHFANPYSYSCNPTITDPTIKTVIFAILERLNLEILYIPASRETIKLIPTETKVEAADEP